MPSWMSCAPAKLQFCRGRHDVIGHLDSGLVRAVACGFEWEAACVTEFAASRFIAPSCSVQMQTCPTIPATSAAAANLCMRRSPWGPSPVCSCRLAEAALLLWCSRPCGSKHAVQPLRLGGLSFGAGCLAAAEHFPTGHLPLIAFLFSPVRVWVGLADLTVAGVALVGPVELGACGPHQVKIRPACEPGVSKGNAECMELADARLQGLPARYRPSQ